MRVPILVGSVLFLMPAFWPSEGKGHSQASDEVGQIDPSLEPYVQQAKEAIGSLQTALVKTLTSELKKSGPAGAIHVCRDEAQVITGQVAEEKAIEVGRTSHRLRNPVNAPREWTETFVQDGAGKKASEVAPHVVDLGDRVGVLQPINTLDLCTNCHGRDAELAPEVKAVLADAYPNDRAVGFAPGDLRGWMWAEVPKN